MVTLHGSIKFRIIQVDLQPGTNLIPIECNQYRAYNPPLLRLADYIKYKSITKISLINLQILE